MTSPPSRAAGSRRLDIQGLRAIAVLLVISSHVPIGWKIPGGFVGVDVFFVISGFVITQAFLAHLVRAGSRRVAYARFMQRRAYRLVPALYVLIVWVLVESIVFAQPGLLDSVNQAAGTAMLFVSNLYYLVAFDSYWNPEILQSPLLHTWSLGVEFQIYLVFPALLVVGALTAGRRLGASALRIPIVAVASLASLTIFAWWILQGTASPTDANLLGTAFYLPLPRFWEFGLGALVGLATGRNAARSLSAARAVLVVGLSLMAVGTVWANAAGSLGLAVIPICFGTAAIIWAGGHSEMRWQGFLEVGPLTWIGDRSYSIYLWHWPLLVLVVWLAPGSLVGTALALIATFVIAAGSYRWLEQGIRVPRPPVSWRAVRPMLTIPSVAVLALIGSVVGTRLITSGSPDISAVSREVAERGVTKKQIFDAMNGCQASKDGKVIDCDIYPGAPRVVLLGDSMSYRAFAAVQLAAREHGLNASLRVAGCTIEVDSCYPEVYQYLEEEKPAATIVIANYSRSSDRLNDWEAAQGLLPECPRGPALDQCPQHRQAMDAFATAAQAGLAQLTALSGNVLVALPFPQQPRRVPGCLDGSFFERLRSQTGNSDCGGVPLEWQRERQGLLPQRMRDVAAQFPRVSVWDPTDSLCWDGFCPAVVNGGELLMDDGIHVTPEGSRFLYPEINAYLEPLALRLGIGYGTSRS